MYEWMRFYKIDWCTFEKSFLFIHFLCSSLCLVSIVLGFFFFVWGLFFDLEYYSRGMWVGGAKIGINKLGVRDLRIGYSKSWFITDKHIWNLKKKKKHQGILLNTLECTCSASHASHGWICIITSDYWILIVL